MTIKQIKNALQSPEYDFLKTNPNLGPNVILLTVGGSHAYGTNTENSDLDIRGCALNSKRQLLTGENFEQVIDNKTDTTIYAFQKLIQLLRNVNPNVIEMLGNKPEHYFYIAPIGQELLDNASIFLSQKACASFGGYASQQLYRLQQSLTKTLSQADLEAHILKTLQSMQLSFPEKYSAYPEDAIHLYIDKAVTEGYDKEIFMDVTLSHYPVRDYCALWNELQSTVKSYNRIGKRNENALTHNKLGKHMMHLIRLYYMCIDILEKEQIITYREKEHDLLMDIRNNQYLNSKNEPTSAFYDILYALEQRFDYAKKHTNLPPTPDNEKINDFLASVNERVIQNQLLSPKVEPSIEQEEERSYE